MKKFRFAFDSALPLLAVTLFCLLYKERLELLNIAMLYLLPILFTAVRHANGATFVVSLISTLTFDILFVPPVFSLSVTDTRFLLSFGAMIAVGQLVSTLSQRAARAKELESSEMIYAAILDSVSHELRTPLTAVIGASSALINKELRLTADSVIELCETVNDGAKRMEAIIENLLASARFESGTIKLCKSECRIEELVSTALQKCEKIHLREAKLIIEEDLPSVFVDAGLVELGLYNIFDNAFKYGQNIGIELEKTPFGVKIITRNDNSFIDGIQIEQLGQKFTRLSNSGGKSGMGLGLFLCNKIINEHDGGVEMYIADSLFCVEISLKGNV
jgi:two-component system, OmpR family, sensor histidine kinase KdpD